MAGIDVGNVSSDRLGGFLAGIRVLHEIEASPVLNDAPENGFQLAWAR